MKKVLCGVLAAAMCAAMITPAFAAQEATITSSKMIVVGNGSKTAYVYARIENTGDEALKLDSGSLTAVDEAGEEVFTIDYAYANPSYLEPGQCGYLLTSEWGLDENVSIADYTLTVPVDDFMYSKSIQLECVAEYVPSTDGWSSDEVYVYFTNNTEDIIVDFEAVIGLSDAEGNILYVGSDWVYDLGILPGSTVAVIVPVSSEIASYYKEQGIDLSTANIDAIFYINDSDF